MKTKLSILIGGLVIALLVGVIGATNVYAQGSASDLWHGRGPGGGRGLRMGTAELEAAAQVLDMTTEELTTALQSGKTLEQIAEEAGVDYADVQEVVQAAHAEELRARIQQAVEDGTLTQENADWLLEGLEQGFIGLHGGFGLGEPHGPRRDQTPSPTQSSGS